MKEIDLRVYHFINAPYHSGNGPIRNASLDIYPDKPAFQGVELSTIGGRQYYHEIYSSKMLEEDLHKCTRAMKLQTIIRTIKLATEYHKL